MFIAILIKVVSLTFLGLFRSIMVEISTDLNKINEIFCNCELYIFLFDSELANDRRRKCHVIFFQGVIEEGRC